MKTILCALLLCCCLSVFSQSAALDTLTTSDGKKHSGTVIKQAKNGDIDFKTEDDGQTHSVPAAAISGLKRANQQPDDKYHAQTTQPAPSAVPTNVDEDQHVNWSDPTIPHSLLRKHRSGLGLTISGGGLILGGIIIAAGAANVDNTSYANGTTTRTIVKLNGLGVIGILAGLPMVIVGAVKLSKSKKQALLILNGHNK